jgi:hypothetical protein
LLRPPVKTGFCTVGCPQWHIFFQYAGDIFFENKFILKKMKKEEQISSAASFKSLELTF